MKSIDDVLRADLKDWDNNERGGRTARIAFAERLIMEDETDIDAGYRHAIATQDLIKRLRMLRP